MINRLRITKSLIKRGHPDFDFTVFHGSPVTILSKPLEECKLALLTTGGLHLKTDEPFDLSLKNGDCSYRMLPGKLRHDDIAVSHKWYNHKFINADLNCVFPIDRMMEYVQAGVIKSLSAEHISFMGHIYDTTPLIKNAISAGRYLKELGVDIAFLTPTWVLCNQSVGLIARGLEQSGISSVCVSFRKEITALSRPPRILSVRSSAGKPLGDPGDTKMQRNIIEAGFGLLTMELDDMTILDPPYKSSWSVFF